MHNGPPRRFAFGRLLWTPAARDAFLAAGVTPFDVLARHARGDWGDVDAHDWAANDRALCDGTRLFSVYTLPTNVRVWIITEADRSATTILLPADY